jgi:DNA-binding GntR family transcriptional regulator
MIVARALKAQIESGALPVGSGLPTEASLSQQFDVSRHSVREALRQLREAGLITSRQGSGTRVSSTGTPGQFVHAVSSLDELSQYAHKSILEVTGQRLVTADSALAARLGCAPKRQWLRITGVRHGAYSKAVTAWVEVYVHSGFTALRRKLKTHRGSIYDLIESAEGERIVEVAQTIRFAHLSGEAAAALGQPAGAPAIEVERVYRNSRNKTVEVAFTLQPAEQFSHSLTLKREA